MKDKKGNKHRHRNGKPYKQGITKSQEKGKNCYIAAMAHGSTTKEFRNEVKKLVSKIEMDHVKDLSKWNGDVSLFENRNTDLVKIMLQSTAKNKSEI